MSKMAATEAAAEAETLRMRFAIGELQQRCERQEQELVQLRQHVKAGEPADALSGEYTGRDSVTKSQEPFARPSLVAFTPANAELAPRVVHREQEAPTVVHREQECQTDEREFIEQLDLVHREAAQKGKELRKMMETVRLLREELHQEKVVAEQYRGQVEGLEKQLADAMGKQHRAESERSLAEWHLQRKDSGNGRLSRSCTPQPGMSRSLIKAWAEPAAGGNSMLSAQAGPGQPVETTGQDSDDDESAGEDEASVSSEGSEDIEVFHPPPSRGGVRR
jgi:hypothetical protein